jgi:hypothetical protein
MDPGNESFCGPRSDPAFPVERSLSESSRGIDHGPLSHNGLPVHDLSKRFQVKKEVARTLVSNVPVVWSLFQPQRSIAI